MTAPRRATGAQETEPKGENSRHRTPPLVSPQPQGLECAGCGAPGSPPTICAPASTDYALISVFVADGKVELLCGRCRRGRS